MTQNCLARCLNLLNNAIEAVRDNPGKKISLVTADNPTGNHTLTVVDNGRGIAPSDLDIVFIPFYTTKENGSGNDSGKTY